LIVIDRIAAVDCGDAFAGQRYEEVIWLPFLDTYRTMCLAPQPDFRRVLEDVRAMQLAA
jgi:hypothetical protein